MKRAFRRMLTSDDPATQTNFAGSTVFLDCASSSRFLGFDSRGSDAFSHWLSTSDVAAPIAIFKMLKTWCVLCLVYT